MESLRELFLTLGLDADETKFASAQAVVDGLEKALQAVVDAAQAMGKALVDAVMQTEAFGSKVNDLSARTGVGTDALQEIGYAAELSGSSMEEAAHALEILGRAMGAAKGGSAEAQAAFAKLGVRVMDTAGQLRPATEVMYEAADALLKLPEGAERTTAAYAIFGRGAKALGGLLAEGGAGIKAMAQKAHDLGLVMSEESVRKADTFGDSLTTLSAIIASFNRAIGEPLIDALQPLLDAFEAWWKVNNKLVKQKVGEWAKGLGKAIDAMAKVVVWLTESTEGLVKALELLAVVLASYFFASLLIANGGLLGLLINMTLNTIAAGMLGASMVASAAASAAAWLAAAAPVILLTAALVLAALLAEDVYVYLTGGDSMIGAMINSWKDFGRAWLEDDSEDWWLLTALKAALWMITDQIPQAWEDLKKSFGSFTGWKDMLFGPGSSAREGLPVSDASATPQGTAAAGRNYVMAPQLHAGGIVINAAPGQSAKEVATETTKAMDEWWYGITSAALPVAR